MAKKWRDVNGFYQSIRDRLRILMAMASATCAA